MGVEEATKFCKSCEILQSVSMPHNKAYYALNIYVNSIDKI